ncbi:hypothetical protein TWF281_004701 [Arthrobotrys megalospora]
MSRDLLGEFGDFQSSSSSSTAGNNINAGASNNNAFSYPSTAVSMGGTGTGGSKSSQNFDDLLGLFGSSNTSTVGTNNASMNMNMNPTKSYDAFSSLRPPLKATSSEAIFSPQPSSSYNNNQSTTLFSASPHQTAVTDDSFDDDFGDFAEEPLPSSNPSFGPFSNSSSSPPLKPSNTTSIGIPSLIQPEDNNNKEDDDFGTFISTPRVPTPPPQFSLSSTITTQNHLHPPHPPPQLSSLLPLLTTHLLTPLPFLTRLKPLSYPAKQRLLSTFSPKLKPFFTSIILISHVAGRLIASKKLRGRRLYKGSSSLKSSKMEMMKDEREVAECVREYSQILGSLRAVGGGMGLVVAELGVDMAVTTISPSTTNNNSSNSKGGKKKNISISGGEFCWLCGLGPLDRVTKLKEDGEGVSSIEGKDVDGKERWSSGWGHRGCRNWWDEYGSHFK